MIQEFTLSKLLSSFLKNTVFSGLFVLLKSFVLYGLTVLFLAQNASASTSLGLSFSTATLIGAIAPISAILFTLKTFYHLGMLAYYRYKGKHTQNPDEKKNFDELLESQKQKVKKSLAIAAITLGLTGLNIIVPGMTLIAGIVAGSFVLASFAVSYLADRFSTKSIQNANDLTTESQESDTIMNENSYTHSSEGTYSSILNKRLGNGESDRTRNYQVIDRYPERNKPRNECIISALFRLCSACFFSEKSTYHDKHSNDLRGENQRSENNSLSR